jgi:hypothetical protein
MVALGTRQAYSVWRVISVERIVTGEDLVTLKARGALGIIPELAANAVPPESLPKVSEVLDTLVQAAHTSGPESVVDRARDAAACCLGIWWAAKTGESKWRTEDLGALAKRLVDEASVSSSLARVIATLHSRAKPNEQERYASRPLRESDGDFSVAAVAMLLREIGWAES